MVHTSRYKSILIHVRCTYLHTEEYNIILFYNVVFEGHAVAQLVEALRYKSEGRGFDSRWCHCNFSLT